MTLDSFRLQLCDIQGRLFERSGAEGLDSASFARAFMEGPVGAGYDLPFDRTQWMGEAYLLDEVRDLAGGLVAAGLSYSADALYWMGYTYRWWHFFTGESSAQIHRIADAETMNANYAGFHTIGMDLAVENLKELHRLSDAR